MRRRRKSDERGEKNAHQKAYEKALQLLSRRDYSERGLSQKLLGYTESEVLETLRRLKAEGYLNDDLLLPRQGERLMRKGWGPYQIFYKLRHYGFQTASIESWIQGVEREAWLEACKKALNKKMRSGKRGGVEGSKLYRYLKQRGFEGSEISEVLKEYKR